MKTNLKRTDKAYLEDQPKLDALIKELVSEYADNAFSEFECWKPIEDCVEALECKSRDGFIAASDNCGGYIAHNFTTISYIIGTGRRFTSKLANKEVERQYEHGCKCALEVFKEKHAGELTGIPDDKLNYHDLHKLDKSELAEILSEYEYENTSDDSSSIMLEVRVMYGGRDEHGVHTAWVCAAVNWEGPYHRSSISWMPGFKCEDAKEVEVTFKTLAEAKRSLTKALKEVAGKIF